MAFMSNQLWQFIINVSIGLLTIFVSVIIFRRQQSRRSITYRTISATSLLSVNEEVKGEVKILYKDKAVSNVRLIILKIWNSGGTPILPQEYIDPIKFEFEENEEILDADVLETVPSNIIDKVRSSMKLDMKSVTFEPLLLNSKDSITFKVLLTQSKLIKKIDVSGRIVGVNLILNFDKVPPILRPILRPITRSATYLLYLVFLSSVIYLILSRYESSFSVKLLLILSIFFYALIYTIVFIICGSLMYSFTFKANIFDSFKWVAGKFVSLIKYMIYEDNSY
jgi:hypothetical protein